jgi:hypothetical protein
MKNKIYNHLIVCTLIIALIVSCDKSMTDTTPKICYLSSISNTKGNVIERMTYDASNLLVNVTNDSTGIVIGFTYNTQNLVDKVNLAYKVGTKTFNFLATFTYDANGKAIKSVTTVNGNPYQTDVYSFTNTQLTGIISTDSQGEVYASRFQYSGDNIAKVYLKLDNEKEYLYYEVTKFDEKKTLYPEAYKYLTMGLSGLVDEYGYFNKNNILSEKYYEDDGTVFYETDNVFEYNSTSQPTKITSIVNDDGDKSTSTKSYQYNCK